MDREGIQEVFVKVHHAMARAGIEVMLVGGSVRDLLQGKEPKDLDFAVNAHPHDANRAMLDMLHQTIPTGIKHGTFTAIVDGTPVEITSLRVDVETDGRHAEVEFTDDWRLDASRRDLTINAMYMDIGGNVIDYFGGQEDLANNVLRFVGDAATRIEEDHLRIMRYFRFASYLENPKYDRDYIEIIADAAPSLLNISGERIWSELTKIFSGPSRMQVAGWMDSSGILEYISDALHFDASAYIKMQELDRNPLARSPLYFIVTMLRDVEHLDALRSRLKFDSNSYKIMKFIIENRNSFYVPDEADVRERFALGDDMNLLYHYAVFMRLNDICDLLSKYTSSPPPKFPVSGNDLKAFGYIGAGIGMRLEELKVRWAGSGHTLTREELLNGP